MKKDLKLYNVFFPFWMLMLFPQIWIFVLPVNFIVDSLVLIVAMKLLQLEEKKAFYKTNILKVFGIGIFADLIGAGILLVMMIVFEIGTMGDELYMTGPATIISAIIIYFMNYYITFKKYDKKIRLKLALAFAIITAPYTFMTPSQWIYG